MLLNYFWYLALDSIKFFRARAYVKFALKRLVQIFAPNALLGIM